MMFNIEICGEPIETTVRISSDDLDRSLLPSCVYYTSHDETARFSGLQIVDTIIQEPKNAVVTSDMIFVINIALHTPTWTEFDRWVGWTDRSGKLYFLSKDITELSFGVRSIDEYLSIDTGTIVWSGRNEVALRILISRCDSLDDVELNLRTPDPWELLGHYRPQLR
jgi:hypothetical protein